MKDIKISGEPGISAIVHHSQPGQEYVNKKDRTLWRVTRIQGDVVQLHCVNGWEQLHRDTVNIAQFWERFQEYTPTA